MSRDWTPEELAEASAAMKAQGNMSYEEFCNELNDPSRAIYTVKVTLADGNTITTRINGTPNDIMKYYRIGNSMNVGCTGDDWSQIQAVEFLKSETPSPSPLRDNLLVTIGSRAAYMDAAGHITLPAGSCGEDVLARFAAELADAWVGSEADTSFDEYIETALAARFPRDNRR